MILLLRAWRRHALRRIWRAELPERDALDLDGFERWCAARDEDASGRLPPRQRVPHPPEASAVYSAYGNPRTAAWTALHEACYLGHARACASLCRRFPEQVNHLDAYGVSPLRALFLYNDTAPGWRHPGALSLRERFAPLPGDKSLLACALSLFSAGAKIRGGELCAAVHLGLSGCSELLTERAPPQSDRPDSGFPAWSLTREPLADPVHGACLAVACALAGSLPETALLVALACPSSFDGPHARSMVRARRLGEAAGFLRLRPNAAQDALEELCDDPDEPCSPAQARDQRDLAELLMRLGADPWTRVLPSRQGDFSTPWVSMAVRAKLHVARACAQACSPDQTQLDAAACACRQSLWPAASERQAFLAWVDQLSLAETPSVPSAKRSRSKRL